MEFRPFTPESVRFLAQNLVKQHKLKLAGAEFALLVELLGGDAIRLATEIEKLSLFAGTERQITLDDIRTLVPNASRARSLFWSMRWANAIALRLLRSLDVLVRESEYLPLALTFLAISSAWRWRQKEAGIKTSQQAVAHFTMQGVRMWRDRAEQLINTAGVFSLDQLRRALVLLYDADKGMRIPGPTIAPSWRC